MLALSHLHPKKESRESTGRRHCFITDASRGFCPHLGPSRTHARRQGCRYCPQISRRCRSHGTLRRRCLPLALDLTGPKQVRQVVWQSHGRTSSARFESFKPRCPCCGNRAAGIYWASRNADRGGAARRLLLRLQMGRRNAPRKPGARGPRLRRVRAKPRSLPKPSFLVRNMSPDRWLSVALKIPRIPRSGSERKACSVAQHASNLSRVDYDDQTLVYIQTTAARIDHFHHGTPFYRATFYASEKR